MHERANSTERRACVEVSCANCRNAKRWIGVTFVWSNSRESKYYRFSGNGMQEARRWLHLSHV